MAHRLAIQEHGHFRSVVCGVLKGTPELEEALMSVARGRPARILIYPLFMSDGYFVNTVLKVRVAKLDLPFPVTTLPPVGLSADLPDLLHRRSLEIAGEANFKPKQSRLLLVGHGSKIGHASSKVTEKVARQLAAYDVFAQVQTAYLEELPLLHNQLAADRKQTVVVGFFASDGLHAYDDVPAAIAETGANAVYTGAIGSHPAFAEIIFKELIAFSAHSL